MAITGSHLKSRTEVVCDVPASRVYIPLVPTLLGALAVINVASVVMVLME